MAAIWAAWFSAQVELVEVFTKPLIYFPLSVTMVTELGHRPASISWKLAHQRGSGKGGLELQGIELTPLCVLVSLLDPRPLPAGGVL